MDNLSRSLPCGAEKEPLPPVAEPVAAWDYEVVNRHGVAISTADSEDLARATAKRLARQYAELRVERVRRFEVREVIYRPRRMAS